MDHFEYRNGVLSAEAVPVPVIADAVGTPFYCYSTATIACHYRVFSEALDGLTATICYSLKANSNLAVIRTLADLGAGADVVSAGELARALKAGIAAHRIVFSGVGKTGAELAAALDAGIAQINVESEPELALLNDIAVEKGVKAPAAIRINPDIDARTHEKISTGLSENKFGIDWTRVGEIYARAARLPGIDMVGLAVHIGSQLADLEPFRAAFARLSDLVATLRADGLTVRRLDLGGGLGIPYDDGGAELPAPAAYGRMVKDALGASDCELLFEPGRVILGNAGILVTRVLYVKEGASRKFIIVDAAMNDLMRPALYGARHRIVAVDEPGPGGETVDVVGPVCETGDTLARDIVLPELRAGDLLAVRTAGAYGAVMASSYNSRPLIPEVMVKDDDFAVIRRRIGIEELMAREDFPPWLDKAQAETKAKAEAAGR